MSFTADISKWVVKANGNTDKVVRKVVIDMGSSIVMKTPVGDPDYWQSPPPKGYVGGRARANWLYGNGVMPNGALDTVDQSGSATIAKIVAGVSASPTASVHWIANSLPYIRPLEDGTGSPRQAPNGMVRISVEEFHQTVERAARSVR